MRPCKTCGVALENRVKVCPHCESAEIPPTIATANLRSSTMPETDDENRVLLMDILFLPVLAGILFGGAVFMAAGLWGFAAGAGVFMIFLLLRIGGEFL